MPECSVGLQVPANQVISLARLNDNIQGIGNVVVTTTCLNQWTLTVTADNANMYAQAPTWKFLSTVMYISTDNTTWTAFSPSNVASPLVPSTPITLTTSGTNPGSVSTIPVYVKQPVTGGDPSGEYKIKFTFNLVQ